MRLEEVITLVRDKVNDPNSKYWTDLQIASWINVWVRDLFRRKADADPSYGSQVYDVLASETTKWEQFHAHAFLVYLPSWVYRVRRAEYLSVDTAPDGTQQPLTQLPDHIPGAQQSSYGWTYHDNRRIIVTGAPEFRSLRLFVAKVPALLHKGTLVDASTGAGQLYIPAANVNNYPIDQETGALLGASFEILTSNAAHDPTGSVGVVTTASKALNGAVYRFDLTVRPQFSATPDAADVYTMHAEIEDSHINYLVLCVAESMHHRANNTPALEALMPQLNMERRNFLESIAPRNDNITHFIRDPSEEPVYTHPDRDPYWKLY